MKKLSFEEIKKIELDILIFFDDFCKKNNIKYFLAYGTLIGAIRHKGFIPWDDDIDVALFRNDIEKLCNLFPNDGRYRLIKPTDKISRHGIYKIIDTKTIKIENKVDYKNGYLGVDIDIFTFDGEPDSDKEFYRWEKKLYKLTRLRAYTIVDKSKCRLRGKLFLTVVLPFLNKDKILQKRKKLHDLYPVESSNYVGNMENFDNNKEDRFKKQLFDSMVEVEFENRKFPAPIGYDEYLKKVYGDYMLIPPKEQQVSCHRNECFLIDE